MAFSVRRLPFPTSLANVPCVVTLHAEGVSEDGGPVEAATIATKCIFSEHTRRVIEADDKTVMLAGKVIIQGDVAPSLSTVSDGTITIFARTYEIRAGHRPRNPDGSVHHTEFEIK